MPTRAGYSFLGWHGRNIINYNKGYSYNEGYVEYKVAGNNITITTKAYSGTDNGYGCAIIPIEDLTDGKYFFSFNNVSYSGDCNYPIISVMGRISVGDIGTGILYRYDTNVTSGYFDFSTLASYGGYNEYFKSDGYYVSPATSIGTSFEAGTLSFSNLMFTKVSSESEYVAYEPYYIESNTVFSTPGDRTLTAMWSQDSILTGGALQTESDLAQWEQTMGDPDGNTTSGVANVVTEDGYVCTKINVAFNNISYIAQSIKGKYEVQRLYSVTAKIKLKNMVAGVYDANYDYYTTPWVQLYFAGHDTSGEWLHVMNNYPLTDYNNKGWVNVRFVCMTHPGDYSGVTANQVYDAFAYVFLRNYTGDFYIRDFAIAKM